MTGKRGPFGYPEAAGWSVLALVVLLLGAQGLVALRPSAANDLVSLGILSAAVYVFVSALLVGVVVRSRRPPEARPPAEVGLLGLLGIRPTGLALLAVSLGLGGVAQIPADSLRQIVERIAPLTEQEELQRAVRLTVESPVQAVMLVAVVACVVPVAEEIFFRGALFGALTRSGRRVGGAALMTSLTFTLSHADPRLWAPIGVVALMTGYLRVVSGSLLPCMALHVGFNTVTVLGAVTGRIRAGEDVHLPPGWVVGGWLLAAALLVTVGWLAGGSEQAARGRREDEHDR